MSKNLFSFVAGAIVGAVVGYFVGKEYSREYHQKKADQEIAEMRQHYAKKVSKEKLGEDFKELLREEGYIDENDEPIDYKALLAEYGYIENPNNPLTEPRAKALLKHFQREAEANKKIEELAEMQKPYIITPEDFDDGTYENIETLIYWADGVLTDEFDNPVMDIEGYVGKENLTHFGEYEDDSIFVRNDAWSTDIEVLLDTRNYREEYPDANV